MRFSVSFPLSETARAIRRPQEFRAGVRRQGEGRHFPLLLVKLQREALRQELLHDEAIGCSRMTDDPEATVATGV